MKVAILCAVTFGTVWALTAGGGAEANNDSAARTPVLVELFTSEGCSSCPPADEVLGQLARSQPVPGALVIALSEHVDYWNRLGWKDPYSSKLFSERQRAYAAAFRKSSVYTPQIVVDGRAELVGSDARGVRREIANAAREPKLEIAVSRGGTASSLRVRVAPAASLSKDARAEVLLAIVENDLHSQVSRGENSGRRLSHTAVVRRLQAVGFIAGGRAFEKEIPLTLDPSWNVAKLTAVVFVQEGSAGKVLGAAQGAL